MTVEIVSPGDRHKDVITKCEEYLHWGVPHIWVVDPNVGLLHEYSKRGLANVATLSLPEYGLQITLNDLLSGLPA